MAKRIGKQFLNLILVLLGISFFAYLLVYLSPGDPALIMLSGDGVTVNPDTLAALRQELGLDEPFLKRYFIWLINAIKGDLGYSYSTKLAVSQTLKEAIEPTLILAVIALLMTLLISFPLGILAAVKKDSWIDKVIRALTFIGNSMPSFWLALIFLRFFGVKLGWVSVAGGDVSIKNSLLPAFTLAISMSSKYARQVRGIFLEELGKEYVYAALIRGKSMTAILIKDVMLNALPPLLNLLGISLGSLLGGALMVEVVYNWPGLGSLAIKAIKAQDYPLIQGYVLFVAVVYVVINYLVDLVQSLINPQLREGE